MKKALLSIMLALLAIPALAQEGQAGESLLVPVKSEYVCMVNNAAFDKPQIPVQVNGKTYYGCCPMCKDRLTKDANARTAIDPVSGKSVDKAEAIIGKDASGAAYYFENESNMKRYTTASNTNGHDHSR